MTTDIMSLSLFGQKAAFIVERGKGKRKGKGKGKGKVHPITGHKVTEGE
jgi:hypothetical protein